MFRLIKLALWGVIGYALYELYQGFSNAGQSSGQAGGFDRQGRQGAMGGGGYQGQTFSDGGQGMETRTDEPSGTSSNYRVGRGVI